MKYLVGVFPYNDSIRASIFDPDKLPTVSGVFWFVLEAESEEEALFLGRTNWEDYKKSSEELRLKNIEMCKRLKVLGYHQE
jgi:hypothetical protein